MLGVVGMLVGMHTRELTVKNILIARVNFSWVLQIFSRHFVQTQHTFAMQLGTQRVWDYVGGVLCTLCEVFSVDLCVFVVWLAVYKRICSVPCPF